MKRTDRKSIPAYVWCVFLRQGSEWHLLATFSKRQNAVTYRTMSLPSSKPFMSIEKFHRSTGR